MSSRLLGGTAYAAGVAIETSTCWNDDSDWPAPIKPRFVFGFRLWESMQRRVVKLRQPDSMSGGRGMMALEREMMSSGFTNNFGACHECSTLSSHIVLILRANCLWQVQPYFPFKYHPTTPLTLRSVPAAAQLLTTVFERLPQPWGWFYWESLALLSALRICRHRITICTSPSRDSYLNILPSLPYPELPIGSLYLNHVATQVNQIPESTRTISLSSHFIIP